MPYVGEGVVTLVGATTENPSFEINAALLSRAQVFVLKRLDDAALELLLQRAEALLGRKLPLTPKTRAGAAAMLADGDGRYLLTLAEELFALQARSSRSIAKALGGLLQKRAPAYDKDREEHYNLISALHKSIRGSDPDAALYWLARMIAGGEDLLFIARRLVRAAAGRYWPRRSHRAFDLQRAKDAVDFIGPPEGEVAFGASGDPPCHRAKIQRRLRRLERRQTRGG